MRQNSSNRTGGGGGGEETDDERNTRLSPSGVVMDDIAKRALA